MNLVEPLVLLAREVRRVVERLPARSAGILGLTWAVLGALALVGLRLGWAWLSLAAVPAVFLPIAFTVAIFEEATTPTPRPLAERVDAASDALRNAADLIDELEVEVAKRAVRIERVRGDLTRYENLLSLRSEEAAAVADSIQVALRDDRRRSLPARVAGTVLNLVVGAVLGAFVSSRWFR